MIASAAYVKKVMGELKAKKKYGQNFLIDANITDKIARIACDENLTTLEIGPGLGALTEMLLKYAKNVDAYEIDEDMYELLNEYLQDERLRVFNEDFLKTDLSIYKEKINVCGNLPYYVTTPILFKLIESELDLNKITIMVQKEVAERIVSETGSEDYGALSVEIQYLFEVKKELSVPHQVFYPSPKVDSAVISLTPCKPRDPAFEKLFFELVKNCFRMRRKTLHNNLKDLYDEETIRKIHDELSLPEKIRPQELSPADYLKMYDVIYLRK